MTSESPPNDATYAANCRRGLEDAGAFFCVCKRCRFLGGVCVTTSSELSSSSIGTGDGGGRADRRAFLHSLYCLDALCWP